MPVVPAVNNDVLARLARLQADGRLAHAYLFSGPPDSGKHLTALAAAKLLNCQSPGGFTLGCACASCRRIDGGNHPDMIVLERPADKSEIVISQIVPRSGEPHVPLLSRLAVRPHEARVRVVLVRDAEWISVPAANALLKTLEEPPAGTLFLLTTTAPERILPTVFSRCQEIRFSPAGHSPLAAREKSGYDISPPAEGRAAHIDRFILAPASEAMLKEYSADRAAARELCTTVLSFYRDVLCLQSGGGRDLLLNPDHAEEVARRAARMSGAEVNRVIALAVRAIEAADDVFNMKLALTALKEHL